MKKSFVAAAACASAGAVCAQSSAQLFGVVDAGITHATGAGPGSSSKSQLTSGSNTFSRLGLRGSENLGGGLTAGFWLEAGLQNDSGLGFNTNTNNQASGAAGTGGLSFNRRATVSLSGGFGELRLGRDYTPSFWSTALFDPFATGGGIGANQIYFSGLGGLAAPTGTRASNSIGYFLPPNLSGFYGQVMYALGENGSQSLVPGTLVSNPRDGNHAGVRVGYQSGPFNVAVATGRTRYAGGDLRVSNIGASHVFESLMRLKLMGEYYSESLGQDKGRGALLALSLPLGDNEFKASYAQYRRDPAGPGAEPTSDKLALGYVHQLSRRTVLYGTVAYLRNRNGAAQSLAGAVTAPNHAARGMELGMRHSF